MDVTKLTEAEREQIAAAVRGAVEVHEEDWVARADDELENDGTFPGWVSDEIAWHELDRLEAAGQVVLAHVTTVHAVFSRDDDEDEDKPTAGHWSAPAVVMLEREPEAGWVVYGAALLLRPPMGPDDFVAALQVRRRRPRDAGAQGDEGPVRFARALRRRHRDGHAARTPTGTRR